MGRGVGANHKPDPERVAPWLGRPEKHVALACDVIRYLRPAPLLLVAIAFNRPEILRHDPATPEEQIAELMRDETGESMCREQERYLPIHRCA